MKVLELLEELDEIIEVAPSVPLGKKVMVDPNEIQQIIDAIKNGLPDEIQQAQYIMAERSRILEDAKHEYNEIIADAQEKAERHIASDEITIKAKARAEELIKTTKENCSVMKMNILDYTDNMLFNLQEKTDEIKNIYFEDMYVALQETFEKIYSNINTSRDEVKEQIYKAQLKDE